MEARQSETAGGSRHEAIIQQMLEALPAKLYWTVTEVAAHFRMSRSSVNRWIQEGKLEAVVISERDRRIHISSIKAFIINYAKVE
jgi:excisionase family DNA binding protein